VGAIVHADLRRLCQAPGVGKRTAERLAVELRQRLQERYAGLLDGIALAGEAAADDLDGALPAAAGREEVNLTLAALGYETLEIHRALRAVASAGLGPDAPADDWIRDCLRWLARQAA